MPHHSTGPVSLADLLFSQPALANFLGAGPLNLAAQLNTLGGTRSLRFQSPWFVRQPLDARLGTAWPVFCGLLREYGIPIFAPADNFTNVSAGQLPIRFARRHTSQPLVATEMRTADAIELECYNPQRKRWSWPAEVESPDSLFAFVSAVRMAVGANTPVGISLPMGVDTADLDVVVAAQPDFITLDALSSIESTPAVLLDTLRRLRQRADQLDSASRPAVLIVAEIDNALETLKLLALGATAVCIDGLCATWLAQIREPTAGYAGSGMLSDISLPAAGRIDLTPIERGLASLRSDLLHCMSGLGVTELGQLGPDQLRGVSPLASHLAGVGPLVAQ